MKKLLLFDVDGTLLLGQGAGSRAMTTAGRAVLGPTFSLDGVMISGGMDPIIYAHAALKMGFADHETRHDAFRDRYLEELPKELAMGAHQLPGVSALLEALTARNDLMLGLVTGNYRLGAPIKLSAVGLSTTPFALGAFGDEAPTRPAMVALAMQRYTQATGRSIAAADVIVIGDTPRDVDCAKQNGCVAFTVTTGKYDRDALQRAGADYVVDDLSDPAPLLALL